ncbi:MAG: DNA translocase FtsK [Balneolaceae bacterium]|nr:MAG: DNA translocase FtsK [Balneolaceae bacterium]
MAKRNKNYGFSAVSFSRKMEIAGILTIAISFLILLSIASYHPGDYAIARSLSYDSLFRLDSGSTLSVQNWLGPAGAYISYFLVHTLFGYISIVLPVILFFMGWYIFRQKDLTELIWPVAYGVWMLLLVSSIMGWFHNHLEAELLVWSGGSGVAVAGILYNITHMGSIIMMMVLLFVSMLLPLDRDLQKTVDWIKARVAEWSDRSDEESIDHSSAVTARQRADQLGKERAEQQREKARETAEPIEEILERSEEEEKRRERLRQKESEELEKALPRAIIERPSPLEAGTGDSEDDDVEISVYVGKGEEEAGAKELDRQNKQKAKEVPVIKYKFPGIDLLDSAPNEGNEVDIEEIKANKKIILEKLRRHKIEILTINAIVGPTVTLYELEPAPDVKISKIESYSNDLKMATAAHGLRIIAPIPGRSAVGIEVPNKTRETVFIKSVINTRKFVETGFELPVALGKTIENEVFMIDLAKMPHLLIAGATGSGKSVGINTVITCLLYKCHPDELKFVLIDPKKIELSLYRNIQNHFLAVLPGSEEPIVTDTTAALETLQSVTKEMDQRYDLLKMAMVRDLKSYNQKFDSGELDEELGHRHLPYIVVVIDELADLMITAGKQIEEPIARLAQLARAIGIHLVVATQRPSVNVITGTIKANFPSRIAYQVASKVDSRTILDVGGADQLVGSGDMLFSGGAGMTRIQNAYVSTDEVERITAFIGSQQGYRKPFLLPVIETEEGASGTLEDIDELFKEAAKVVVLHQQGSVSLLQRKLKIGYNRAGRIIDQLYNADVVGPFQGSTARDVKIADEEELDEIFRELGI